LSARDTRTVSRLVSAMRTFEGDGFLVHRPFPTRTLLDFDPFLLLDEMGPIDYKSGEAKGAPDHPHRGFETVTYMLKGSFKHQDSFGHAGNLEPGDVQWMTAGSGLVHSEMPSDELLSQGGKLHAFQLWVNLPKKDKMTAPHYQEIKANQIPLVKSEDGEVSVRVIAGSAFNVNAVIRTKTPIIYLHVTMNPGAKWKQPVDNQFNLFAYVFAGRGTFGPNDQGQIKTIETHQLVLFNNDGHFVEVNSVADNTEPLEILLIGGVPLKEPVMRYGPFVMNTEEEIRQAFIDFHTGKMGVIKR
jgi:redox-sensitive bicupin YhaK (pirin superfamily)